MPTDGVLVAWSDRKCLNWCSKPNSVVMLSASLVVRVRVEELASDPPSLRLITTVRMSPTRVARRSLKKVRAPARHSEFGMRSATWGGGIGRLTGL